MILVDFNEDQLINVNDIEQVVLALTRNELSQEEIAIVCEKVLEEADIDDDKCISFSEFTHVISRAPEFLKLVSNKQKSSHFKTKPWLFFAVHFI